MNTRQTFRKSERLCSRKIIEQLTLVGKSIRIHPFRLVWLQSVSGVDSPAQVAFAVPKKNIRKAVDRNTIKRRMREAYRKNKSTLYALISQYEYRYALLFVFTGKEEVSYLQTEEIIREILRRFAADIQKGNS